jgi:hypothetical protein
MNVIAPMNRNVGKVLQTERFSLLLAPGFDKRRKNWWNKSVHAAFIETASHKSPPTLTLPHEDQLWRFGPSTVSLCIAFD